MGWQDEADKEISASPSPQPSVAPASSWQDSADQELKNQSNTKAPLTSRLLDAAIQPAKNVASTVGNIFSGDAFKPAPGSFVDTWQKQGWDAAKKQANDEMAQLREEQNAYDLKHQDDSGLEKLKRFFTGDPNRPGAPVYGNPPLAIPVGAAIPAAGFGARAFDIVGKVPEAGLTAPQALTNVANFMGGVGKLPSAARVGSAAALGAANKPEDPVVGAILGAGPALAMEGLSSAKLPGKMLGMKGEESLNYAENPEQADRLYNLNANEPGELNKQLRAMGKNAVYGNEETGQPSLFDTMAAPALKERGERLAGTNLNIKTDQLRGTAAENELRRVAALQNPGSVEHKLLYGAPANQSIDLTPDYGYGKETADIPVSTVETKSIPSPQTLPEDLSVTGPQAERMKEILQNSAYEKSRVPGYSKNSDIDAAAAIRMQSAVEAMHPRIAPINSGLQENLNMQRGARDLFDTNPAKILNNSESIGSVPVRTLRDYLDKNAGTNFGELADSLQAGKAFHSGPESHGVLKTWLTDPAARFGLRNNANIAPIMRNLIQSDLSQNLMNGSTPYNKKSPWEGLQK